MHVPEELLWYILYFFLQNWDEYGIDFSEPPIQSESQVVTGVQDVEVPLSESDVLELQSLFDPLKQDDSYGVTVYLDVLNFVKSKLSLGVA